MSRDGTLPDCPAGFNSGPGSAGDAFSRQRSDQSGGRMSKKEKAVTLILKCCFYKYREISRERTIKKEEETAMKKRWGSRWLFALIVLATFCLPTMGISSEINVALGKTVTLNGTVYGAGGSTLTDGTFLPRSTQWQTGTVWWNGTAAYAEIDLGDAYVINSMIAQADDNDAYLITYHDVLTDSWKTAWDVPATGGWGMQTRPNPGDDSERYVLSSSITADILRFYAVSGDNSYSVSEIQAYGSAVPLPGALWLFALGLAALAGFRKKLTETSSRSA